MNITINGTQVNTSALNVANLEEALVQIQKTSLPINHLVGTVLVNGNEFSELYPGQARDVGIDRVHNLDINTVSLEQFGAAAVKDCFVLIGRIAMSALHCAELFRMYDEAEAYEQYGRLIDSLRALIRFIEAVRHNLDWNFSMPLQNGVCPQNEWDALLGTINELSRVQEENDIILLADVLEYELVASLNKWKDLFACKAEPQIQ
jgi:hypothetical protein